MDFIRKARYVAGGHLTNLPDNVPTYTSVISCKLLRILFLVAAMYSTEVLGADISNAFLNAQCAEKVCFKEGPKFNIREGLWVIIVCALYGLKSNGASFRAHISNTLRTMIFKPKFDNRDVWMRNNFPRLPQ